MRRCALHRGHLHQLPHIVIAGHAMHWQAKWLHNLAEAHIRLGRVVLYNIAGHRHHVGWPLGPRNMVNNGRQGRVRDHAPQTPVRISEQMRICYMENPGSNRRRTH